MSKKKYSPINSSRYEVLNSKIHGKGFFAIDAIDKGECIIEYKGERISWDVAIERHPHDITQPNHTFYFSLSNGNVIDANFKGNSARWINHSCKPNCEAVEIEDTKSGFRVFLLAKKKIKSGEELFYDYALDVDCRKTKALKKEYECRCGKKECRGTMLSD